MITIEAICTPDICDPLPNQNVKVVSTNYNHLKNLQLADSSNTDSKSINILIGLDYYYLFVTGDIIRGEPNEPFALNSIFGRAFFVEFLQKPLTLISMSQICFVLIHCEIKRVEYLRKEILFSLISTAIMTPASRCFRKTIINTFSRILRRTFNLKIIATLQNFQLGKQMAYCPTIIFQQTIA